MKVALVDYGSGNIHSAQKALERSAREAGVAAEILVTHDPDEILAADRLVLPGVGAFADCKGALDAVPGLVPALEETVHERGTPFLGICVGMQLLADRGREYETVPGLAWIAGEVVRLEPSDPELRIPHMGWNTLETKRDHPLLEGIETGAEGLHGYFVHSYELRAADPADIVATADYGGPVTALVARGNVAGTQFHPEKSQRLGLALLGNFLRWKP